MIVEMLKFCGCDLKQQAKNLAEKNLAPRVSGNENNFPIRRYIAKRTFACGRD